MKLTPKEKRKLDKEWSKKIRLVGRCDVCSSTKYLNAHHILDKRFYQEYRFEKKNLICLCVRCHKFSKLSAHRNPVWFSKWLKESKPEQYRWVEEHL